MGSRAQGPYGRDPSGQPAPMQPGEFVPAQQQVSLWGMGNRAQRGKPKTIIVPNPAPGADWTYTVPGQTAVVIHFGTAQLTTSAAVANRLVHLGSKSSGVTPGFWVATTAQTAGTGNVYTIGHHAGSTLDPAVNYVFLPYDVWLTADMTFFSQTTNIQAGDQWSAIALYVEEFTDECFDAL